MLVHVFLLFFTYCLPETFANGHCIDIHSHIVSQGLHYVPGPNTCTLCICDKGSPKWCKSVLCSPPQNCKSFEVGASCCEFKCLDGILTKNDNYSETYDLALRLIASLVTAVLSLSLLFFLIHRLRQRKIRVRQNRQLSEDQRSLNSIGYIAGSLGYLPGSIGYLGSGNNELEFHYEESGVHYPLWKPPGNYFPRGEAPPPYEEAVRAARVESSILVNNHQHSQIRNESNITNTTTNSPLSQATISSYQPNLQQSSNSSTGHCRHGDSLNANQEYANITVQSVTIHQANDTIVQNVVGNNENGVNVDNAPDNRCFNHGSVDNKNTTFRINDNKPPYENIVIHSRNEWPTTSADSSNAQLPTRKSSSSIANHRDGGSNNLEQISSASKSSNRYENVFIKNGSTVLKDAYNTLKKTDKKQTMVSMRPEYLYDDINIGERFYENTRHRTIPNLQEFKPKDNSVSNSKNKSQTATTLLPKRELDKNRIGERSESNLKNLVAIKDRKDIPIHRTLPKNLRELCIPPVSATTPISSIVTCTETNMNRSYSNNLMHRSLPKHLSMQVETPLSVNLAQQSYITYADKDVLIMKSSVDIISPQNRICNIEMEDLGSKFKNTASSAVATKSSMEVDVDKCGHSSYQCLNSVSTAPDEDDYRSECENCKSSSYQEGDGEESDLVNETMTLQRRPLEPGEEVPYYRTSLTLPTNTRKPRAVTPNPGRESWFMAMQETSSSDDSE